MLNKKIFLPLALLAMPFSKGNAQTTEKVSFDKDWLFYKIDSAHPVADTVHFAGWRSLTLPHDWSIEAPFSDQYPTTPNQGALPGGIGWYAKKFKLSNQWKGEAVNIDFDGVYRNSEVWINGHYLGKRPSGYVSFRYNLTPFLYWDNRENTIVVKVDNTLQPESRWYTGAGIYRNVWLSASGQVSIAHWGTFVQADLVKNNNGSTAKVHVQTTIDNRTKRTQKVRVKNIVVDADGKEIISKTVQTNVLSNSPKGQVSNDLVIENPITWSPSSPNLYSLKTIVLADNGTVLDSSSTAFGVRHIAFDREQGFFLNYSPLKILGVCLHHDQGALGTAVNTRAIERQLQLLKDMGCNAIRTSHNAPAPELLDLCDKMGFMVMDEFFDMWAKKKNKFDYHLDFPKWYQQDVEDQMLRDRNHPSIIMWSIGNEIREQFDTSGVRWAKTLAGLVRSLDTSRPITSALTQMDTTKNYIYQSHALDVLGWNYNEKMYPDFLKKYPGQKFIASETVSALESRGHYDQLGDTVLFWPASSKEKFVPNGNKDFTVSAYDQVAAYWGSTHEATWKIIKKYPFLSGTFVWTGFDYLGEPTPYPYPARSSYFGIIDLAGFPKDVYYMYQSEWSSKNVLHLLPHWNWTEGKNINVWAYYNNADEVELYLNGKSLGIRKKQNDDLHVQWNVPFSPGILKAVSRKNGNVVMSEEIKTAGKPAKIKLVADRSNISSDGTDLSYVTVEVTDKDGNIVPDANNEIQFSVNGSAFIAGTDNGQQTDLRCLKSPTRNAFNGKALAILQSNGSAGQIQLTAKSAGLETATIVLDAK